MASLKEIRTRIASVTSTRQITNAMKMVSASKLKKAQDRILQIRPYANKLQEILGSVSDALSKDEDNIYLRDQEPEHILIVVVTSNRGLCGAFNANVMRTVAHLASDNYRDLMKKGDLHFFAVGKRGADYLKRKKYPLIGVRNDLFDGLNFKSAGLVGEDLIHKFLVKEYDRIFLIYNQFKNAAVQILTTEQFLPIEVPESEEDTPMFHDYIFEPTKEYIVKELIPKSLKIQFYKALLDSNASEHGARMTAMHQATDNATELLRELRLHYNKARQAAITKELLEIVSGAEALKG
jgi:F-type H+-transporting ATPase subunit gamma